ncbi:trypsin-like serine peptidase [Acetobacter nitrogenifigens]|nr:trypsin-like serine protease [Acetobacter nitrogenifigens]
MPKRRYLAAFLMGMMLAVSPHPAHAAPALPGVGASDARSIVNPDTPPWSALGRVQTALGGRCTGFLIAPNVVETAAHCLYLPKTGRYIQPGDVHFLRAYSRGRYAAHARVGRFLVPPGYDPRNEATTAAYDRATLFLDAPVADKQQTLEVAQALPEPETPVAIGGYEQDYQEILIRDQNCHVTAIVSDQAGRPMIAHDCAATRGSSGAPVLTRQGDHWVALGIQALANPGRGGVAAPLSQ